MSRQIYFAQTKQLRNWLKKGRISQGLTMRDLAEKLDASHSYIGKIELGERRLDIVEYARYCRILGLSPESGIVCLEEDADYAQSSAKCISNPSIWRKEGRLCYADA